MKKILGFLLRKANKKATKKRLHRQFLETQKWIAAL